MNRTSARQALFAGIGGASLAFMPETALGFTLSGLPEQLLKLPFAPFVIGILGGAAVAGGVYGIVVKVADMSDAPKIEKAVRTASGAHARHAASEQPVAASVYRPRHMSPQDFEKSGVIRVQPADTYVEMEQQVAKRRQKHLKPTIMERLGVDMMDGIPVIERADGTVADVGTSWWTRGVNGKAIVSASGFSGERPVDDFLHEKSRLTPQTITHRVAQIDEGLYPEKRTADDLDKSDVWTSALEALDERLGTSIGTPVPIVTNTVRFRDSVGGTDSLDEPDNLEQNTGFIPFRVPAGHPEVTDTNSYINHLVSDEFSRNPSSVARTSSRHYMRVIEGGTHNLKTKGRVSADKTGTHAYVGKHFAPMAAEA